jgi:hypothetical protein
MISSRAFVGWKALRRVPVLLVLSVLCKAHGGYGENCFESSEAQMILGRCLASLIGAMFVSMRISAVRRCGMRSSAVEELPTFDSSDAEGPADT